MAVIETKPEEFAMGRPNWNMEVSLRQIDGGHEIITPDAKENRLQGLHFKAAISYMPI